MTDYDATRECARSLDEADQLAKFREQFNFPDDRDGRNNIYVCGNSLGLQPKKAVQYVTEVMSEWSLQSRPAMDAISPPGRRRIRVAHRRQ